MNQAVFSTALMLCACLCMPVAAATLTLATEQKAPPEPVSQDIRDYVDGTSVVLSDGAEPVWEFWFAKKVTFPYAPEEGQAPLDVLKTTTLLGILRLHRDQRDYKDDLIEKGVYTLRYARQPQDGNHMGTAPFPSFVVLLPASFDKKVDLGMDHDDMVDESIDSAVAEHPMNLSLQPLDELGASPALAEGSEKTKVLDVEITAVADGKELSPPLRFRLVYEGVGKVQ